MPVIVSLRPTFEWVTKSESHRGRQQTGGARANLTPLDHSSPSAGAVAGSHHCQGLPPPQSYGSPCGGDWSPGNRASRRGFRRDFGIRCNREAARGTTKLARDLGGKIDGQFVDRGACATRQH